MAFFDPARSQDFLFISGTKVKSDSTFHYSYFVTKRDISCFFGCRCVAWRRRKRTHQTVSCVPLGGKCWLIITTVSTQSLVTEGFQKLPFLLECRDSVSHKFTFHVQ